MVSIWFNIVWSASAIFLMGFNHFIGSIDRGTVFPCFCDEWWI